MTLVNETRSLFRALPSPDAPGCTTGPAVIAAQDRSPRTSIRRGT